MKHRRGASSWAYCVVAVLIASTATPLAASANNASCSSSDVDLCPISQPVMEALEVSGHSPVVRGHSHSVGFHGEREVVLSPVHRDASYV